MRAKQKSFRCPPIQKSFVDHWDEMGYLNEKLFYWLHVNPNCSNAKRHISRMKQCIKQAGEDAYAAFLAISSRALVSEYEEEWDHAFFLRTQRTIQLIGMYYHIADDPKSRDFTIKDDYPKLVVTRFECLKHSYRQAGQAELAKKFTHLQKIIRKAGKETGANKCTSSDDWFDKHRK